MSDPIPAEFVTNDATVRKDICKLAYDESAKGLSIQDATLTSIRQAAAAMGTLAGLAATFLGKEVLTRASASTHNRTILDADVATVIALVALGASLVAIVFLFLPRANWAFHSSAAKILNQFARPEETVKLDVTYETIAGFNEENYASNAKNLGQMFIALDFLMATVIVQVIAWLCALF